MSGQELDAELSRLTQVDFVPVRSTLPNIFILHMEQLKEISRKRGCVPYRFSEASKALQAEACEKIWDSFFTEASSSIESCADCKSLLCLFEGVAQTAFLILTEHGVSDHVHQRWKALVRETGNLVVENFQKFVEKAFLSFSSVSFCSQSQFRKPQFMSPVRELICLASRIHPSEVGHSLMLCLGRTVESCCWGTLAGAKTISLLDLKNLQCELNLVVKAEASLNLREVLRFIEYFTESRFVGESLRHFCEKELSTITSEFVFSVARKIKPGGPAFLPLLTLENLNSIMKTAQI